MAERELQDLLRQLHQTLQSHKYQQSTSLLSRAKVALLQLNTLIPTESTPKKHLALARETLELGALISIRLQDPVSFTRYFQQLQPFYALPESTLPKDGSNSSKITGLYLLLLLSDGDYAGFHTLLETLEVAAAQSGKGLEQDPFVQYPVRLEQALMEGSYDRVWGETKGERVPSEEFGMFTEVLIGTIRKEIASCSEKAYPSIPISDAKSLLFLESEGSVVQFAKESGWVVKDGRIYFPQQDDEYQSKDILVTSDQVIENTLGYARELETIV
jgi:26S proteasome regulatory subunit N12